MQGSDSDSLQLSLLKTVGDLTTKLGYTLNKSASSWFIIQNEIEKSSTTNMTPPMFYASFNIPAPPLPKVLYMIHLHHRCLKMATVLFLSLGLVVDRQDCH